METRSKLKSQNESHPPSIQPPTPKQQNEQTTEASLNYISGQKMLITQTFVEKSV